ncbi:response regulator transcription factor [Leptolyngbya ohadii]|uniref:response regulator transcription factor n=1 Tax=Leptolyngbya ohadii TaxID=1962290 RepID=UPI000B59A905|nr:response regulator [Leptolyngbya ohadii]
MRKILVIEDEVETRELFLRCLTFEGFWAIGAAGGAIGVKLAQMHTPDLIVCDIMMPDLDGYSVLSQLRQQSATAGIPFIFLTAKVTMADLRCGMELGADDYLTKPCTIEQFLTAITVRLQRQDELKTSYDKATPALQEDQSTVFPNCPRLREVFEFIEMHYHLPISLADVAQAAGYSPPYLTTLAQEQTGRTIKQWITERRMVQARQLLTNTSQSIGQITKAVGYQDASYFIRQFRQIHGISPQAWRQSTPTIA